MIEIFFTILLGHGLSCFLDWSDDFMDKRLGKKEWLHKRAIKAVKNTENEE